MSIVIPLVARAKVDAEEKLKSFIASSKSELTSFGADLDFDADKWDVTEYYSKKGHRNSKHGSVTIHFTQRKRNGGEPFCPQLKGFAKAYVRSQLHSQNSASWTRAIRAFRALDAALQTLDKHSLVDCDATVFNKASLILQEVVGLSDDSSSGSVLGIIARFMDEHGFVYAPLHNWQYIKRRKSTFAKIGPEFEERRQKLLPSQEALDALPQAFNLATEARDVLVTSLAAILCSAPERINEVLLLREKCEVEQSASDGRKYLGLRWSGSKGASDHIKWVLPGMADVVRRALVQIRLITAPAREMAMWYERNPTALFLPPPLEYLRAKEILTLDEVGPIANLVPGKRAARKFLNIANVPLVSIPSNRKGRSNVQAVRFADLEKYIVSMLPTGFPMYDATRRLKYSEALLVIPFGLFRISGDGAGSPCMFEVFKYHHIGCALGQNANAGSKTIFQRVGIDPDRLITMKSHQFRHWLNTLAQGANLSQVDIAKWSGRVTLRQNDAYDHTSSEEIVTQIRASLGDHAKAIGILAEIPKNLPVARAEFARMTIPTAHLTLYGFCIHDFTALPCEMFRQCLECREHVCIKGTPGKTQRIEDTLEGARRIRAQAHQAMVDGQFGAADWLPTHDATVARLEQLLAILTDPKIADGAVVLLNASGTYSLSEGALRDRRALDDSSNRENLRLGLSSNLWKVK